MHKLSGANKRFGRCPIHGQDCEVAHEVRTPVPRKTEKSKAFEAAYLELYTEEGGSVDYFYSSLMEERV